MDTLCDYPNLVFCREALSHDVLAVAAFDNDERRWWVTIKAVRGVDHSKEWEEVVRHGNIVDRRMAMAIFHLASIPTDFTYGD